MKTGLPRASTVTETDVCLIVEGCYPYIPGGVSSWIDWLMRSQKHLDFSIVAIAAGTEALKPRFELPPNAKSLSVLSLHEPLPTAPMLSWSSNTRFYPELAEALIALIRGGGLQELARVVRIVNAEGGGFSRREMMSSRMSWDIVCRMYERIMPHASFLHFYWAWRALFGGLFATLKFPLPRARIYHTISTGYAGLVAARAAVETGRPSLITEHGIYTNERRIEILMADWINDSVDKGLAIDDDRVDLRDIWMQTFDGYARACYDACSAIITLYEDNQRLQLGLGASSEKLRIIANGIKLNRFDGIPTAAQDAKPTMALIGRVVPIKDIKTFIAAASIVREQVRDIHALVLGSTEEDPGYYRECVELIHELGLNDCVSMPGNANLVDYFPEIHVVVLTSLSEAQPLVLLEAGAAGVPCVTTNVGSCREILEGRSSEEPALGRGGYVTDLVAPLQISDAVCRLLKDEDLRRQMGDNLRRRVRKYYASEIAEREYRGLYEEYLTAAATRRLIGVA
jgi:glycosyltransferase involved in cell wall biosynthesis